MVLLALALPLVVEALPFCSDEPMEDCGDGLTRCAGLWGAACCDFTSPRPRLQDTIDAPAPAHGLQALPGVLYGSLEARRPELPDPERVPTGNTTGAGAGPILSSTVLRL